VSKPDSFTFSLGSRLVIEDAIKFNLSNFNTLFFDSIDQIGAFPEKRKIAPQLPPVLPSQLRWTFVQREEDPAWTAIYPENPGDILFRGQGKRFMPCVPTAARGIGIDAWLLQELSEANQARLLVNFMKTEWFVELLRETAAVKWLKEKRIFLDEMAVAQHYGLPTGYIDLTQSFDVAAFFACCRYDPATKSWAPVADAEGVVYVVNWRELTPGEFIRPINLQVFPRPSEQWGWTCELRLGDDFDKLPFVRKFVFKHDLQASQRILAKFSQGRDLFPDDPLSELADKIIASPVLPTTIAERIATDVINDPKGKPGSTVAEILSLVQAFFGIRVSTDAGIADMGRINSKLDDVWRQKKEDFFTGIGIHLVRQRKETR
jgi:FRG domain